MSSKTKGFVQNLAKIIDAQTKSEQAKSKLKSEILKGQIERKQNLMAKSQQAQEQSELRIKEKQSASFQDIQAQEFRENQAKRSQMIPKTMADLPHQGDVDAFASTKRQSVKNNKLVSDYPDEEALYKMLLQKKEIASQNPQIEFDEQDEKKLNSLQNKIYGMKEQKTGKPTFKTIDDEIKRWDRKTEQWISTGASADKKLNKATKDQLQGLAAGIGGGDFKTKKDALDMLEQNADALAMSGVDIDYLKQKIEEVLPDEYDSATFKERWIEKSPLKHFMKGQKFDRRKKYGVWYEKQEDGKWHKEK